MNEQILRYVMLAGILSTAVFSTGCAAVRANVSDVDVEEGRHLRATYDYADMREITEKVVADFLDSRFLVRQDTPPVLMVAGIENRTSRYVDTKNLTDRIRTMLFQSGEVQFVTNERRDELMREQGYQAAHATLETQAAIGRQIGAGYMLSGSFVEMEKSSMRQVRVSRTEVNYYKLTVEVTDLETGLLAWTTEVEFAREARKPLIGW